jgi:hypothetical protein
MSDSGFATNVNGVPLQQWVGDLLGGAVSHVGVRPRGQAPSASRPTSAAAVTDAGTKW